jgi:DHA1 family tetracycline resistance protein-like MFS transporter
MTLGFLGYAFATQGWMMYAAIFVGSLGGIGNPAVQSVMSRQAGPSAQGELQGVVASLSSVAAVLSPIMMTQLFAKFSVPASPVYFPGVPYFVSALLVFACVFVAAKKVVPGVQNG